MCRDIDRDVSFRAATPADLEWLVGLRLETMGVHLRAAGEDVSPANHHARVMKDFGSIRIVIHGSQPIGMVKVVKEPDQWRLVQIQVVPERQGKGIGSRIICGLLDDARLQGIPVVLSVLKLNPAKRLYERLGFKVVAEQERAYEMRHDS